MAECEICGKPLSSVRRARIDGAVFTVCEGCSGHGTPMPVIARAPPQKPAALPQIDAGPDAAADSGQRIRKERERRGLSRADLAKAILETESQVARAERGVPVGDAVLKKLERFLGVSLHEEHADALFREGRAPPPLTLGDVAEIRRRRS